MFSASRPQTEARESNEVPTVRQACIRPTRRHPSVPRLPTEGDSGVDVGCRRYKPGKWQKKVCLVLVAEKYQYHAAISDISGSDPQVHSGKPDGAVKQVRNWLNNHDKSHSDGPQKIWTQFNIFRDVMWRELKASREADEDIDNMPTDELIRRMQQWVAKKTKKSSRYSQRYGFRCSVATQPSRSVCVSPGTLYRTKV